MSKFLLRSDDLDSYFDMVFEIFDSFCLNSKDATLKNAENEAEIRVRLCFMKDTKIKKTLNEQLGICNIFN